MLPVFLFPTYMGTLMLDSATKSLEDLSHVKGTITNLRFIKHERKRKFKTIYEDVLVLGIEGCSDEFGFMGKKYDKLFGMRMRGRYAEIFYDSDAKRIEQDITLHVFDMTIGNYRAVDIDEERKSEWFGASVCFAISTIVLTLAILGVVRIGQNRF
jgi:hypothetical protein